MRYSEEETRTLEHLRNNLNSNYSMLADNDIKMYNNKGYLIEQPLTDIQLQPNSVDLTLGGTWKRLRSNSDAWWHRKNGIKHVIDTKNPIESDDGIFNTMDDGSKFYMVKPGEFILMASNEILNIPNGIVSLVCGRSSVARLGITTEDAGFIDAGFRGTITFEIYNKNEYPVVLYEGMRIAQVYFFQVTLSDRLYGKEKGSKYVDQIEATESKIHLDPEFQLPAELTKTPDPEVEYETLTGRPPKN